MAYQKPQVVAMSAPKETYAAGCPSNLSGGAGNCKNCDRTQ